MRFQCGVYCGSFNPLHMGHVKCILQAAALCEKLILVLGNGTRRDEIDLCVRCGWVREITKHLDHVQLLVLEDDAPTKEDYTEAQWYADAEKVRGFAGQPVDALFCGSDYSEDSMWSKSYPEAEIVIFPRDGISSTKIRENPMAHLDWLPGIVRLYYETAD